MIPLINRLLNHLKCIRCASNSKTLIKKIRSINKQEAYARSLLMVNKNMRFLWEIYPNIKGRVCTHLNLFYFDPT